MEKSFPAADGVDAVERWLSQSTRSLSDAEVVSLKAGGNICVGGDWRIVRVRLGNATTFSASSIRSSTFGGKFVVVGSLGGNECCHHVEGVDLPSGIYSSTVADCIIGDHARVDNTTLIARCFVGRGALISGCGIVCMKGRRGHKCAFSNGRTISIAHCRELSVYAEMTFEEAAGIVGNPSDKAGLAHWVSKVRHYTKAASHTHTVVCAGSQLICCPRVENAFIGRGARIDGSTIVDATILSCDADELRRTVVEGGCLVEHSIIQHGCRCSSMAIVSSAFMCTKSAVERHAKLIDSVLGPCSSAAEGEISTSLVGWVPTRVQRSILMPSLFICSPVLVGTVGQRCRMDGWMDGW